VWLNLRPLVFFKREIRCAFQIVRVFFFLYLQRFLLILRQNVLVFLNFAALVIKFDIRFTRIYSIMTNMNMSSCF
jgi:hypothetical protein